MDHHPVAALFPMLADDELADLAADIAERGLLQPIVLDGEGRILDGRNRYAACEMASVEPRFETYDGTDEDAAGYALAVNLSRRHLTKGQRAGVIAKAVALSDMILPADRRAELAKEARVADGYIGRALYVGRHDPDSLDLVVAGALPLNSAYEKAQAGRRAVESDEGKLAALRKSRPDLADQVVEERLTLTAALAAMRADEQEAKRRRRVATELLCEHVVAISQLDGTAERYDPEMAISGRAVTREVIREAKAALAKVEQTWKERRLP